jgi:hypothetical protein
MNRLFRNGRYANVTATLALVVALGGTAYAAVSLPKDSVRARQIDKGAVRAAEIKRGAVRSSEVRDGSLKSVDFDAADLPKGEKGDPGAPGDPATSGPGRSVVAQTCDPLADNNYVSCASVTLTLPADGRVALVWDSTWDEQTPAADGRCRFTGPGTSNHQIEIGAAAQGVVGLNEVTTSLPAGDQTLGVECRELAPAKNTISFDNGSLSAVYVGAS